jgi:hypothetical protein
VALRRRLSPGVSCRWVVGLRYGSVQGSSRPGCLHLGRIRRGGSTEFAQLASYRRDAFNAQLLRGGTSSGRKAVASAGQLLGNASLLAQVARRGRSRGRHPGSNHQPRHYEFGRSPRKPCPSLGRCVIVRHGAPGNLLFDVATSVAKIPNHCDVQLEKPPGPAPISDDQRNSRS